MAGRLAVVKVLIVLATSSDMLLAQNDGTYTLNIVRSINNDNSMPDPFRNTIELRCSLRNGSDDPEARFWLGRPELEEDIIQRDDIVSSPFQREFGVVGIRFGITRELEGNYSCGRREMTNNGILTDVSPTRPIVALPVTIPSLEDTTITTFYTTLGSDVTLLCPITPGKYLSRYFVNWIKLGIRNTTVAQIEPITHRTMSIQPGKYSISDANFSLMISEVDGADNSTRYICSIGVMNFDNIMYTYEQVERLILTLIVADSQTIIAGPKPQTVSISQDRSEQQHAEFNCTATGISRPSITWYHNGERANNASKYSQNPSSAITQSPNGQINVTSTFRIMIFEDTDSGNVSCRLSDTQESMTTTIAVLGKPATSDVIITMDEDVFIVLRFSEVIPTLMKLDVRFMNTATNMQSTSSGIRKETYANTMVLRQEWKSSDVPERFTVTVHVVGITESGAQIVGPPIDFNGTQYNKNKQNQCEFPAWAHSATGVVVFLGLCLIVLISILAAVCCYKIRADNQVQQKRCTGQNDTNNREIAVKGATEYCKLPNLAQLSPDEISKEWQNRFESIYNHKLPEQDGESEDKQVVPVQDKEVFMDFLKITLIAGIRCEQLREETKKVMEVASKQIEE